jgi:hypothetical protein
MQRVSWLVVAIFVAALGMNSSTERLASRNNGAQRRLFDGPSQMNEYYGSGIRLRVN